MAVFVFSLGEKGWDSSWEGGQIAMPPAGSWLEAPFVYLPPLFLFFGAGLDCLQSGTSHLLWSPPHL